MLPVIITACATSVMTLMIASRFQHNVPYFAAAGSQAQPSTIKYASFSNDAPNAGPANFEMAAENSVKAVVHIKTTTSGRTVAADYGDVFSQLFGQRQYYIPPQSGSGSGVVISQDGYIVTNNHVVANANEITVTFNDRYTAQAKLIATDPATDIAVIKVPNDKSLPFLEFGNSDDVRLGQWVLAVGYPLSLDATVTAGIISAKGRSLGINKQQSAAAIESFLQTDAAVNPGNSGGALVNTTGQLIGINSAIASPTGSYAGYSYAIPANIVRKAVNDLIKFGSVQRGYLGIQYQDLNSMSTEEIAARGMDKSSGVYVVSVIPGSGAAKAGIKEGDFITRINGIDVNTQPELQGQIARYQPGDNVSIVYSRNGNSNTVNVQLSNLNENASHLLGASFRPLNAKEKSNYNLNGGVLVTDVGKGVLSKQTQMRPGFIITGINNMVVNSLSDIQQVLAGNKSLQIAGFYPGYQGMYYYGVNNIDGSSGQE
jgi:Do/DeqQ family serine protease